MAISDLTVAEFCVSLARRVKLGTLSNTEESKVLVIFGEHMAEGALHRIVLGREHYELAGQLAAASSVVVRTLDALHLAVASSINATIATFDIRMAQAARSLDLEVIPAEM